MKIKSGLALLGPLLIVLLFSCKTMPVEKQYYIHSPVDPDSDLFLQIGCSDQQELIYYMASSLAGADPSVLDLIDRSQWVFMSMQKDYWIIDLYGNFNNSKLSMALGFSKDWDSQKIDGEKIYQNKQTGISLKPEGSSHIWIFSRLMEYQLHSISMGEEEEAFLSFKMILGRQSLLKLQQSNPSLNLIIEEMQLTLLKPGINGSYPLEIQISGTPGKERALTALGKLSMLSLVGRTIMDAHVTLKDNILIFDQFSLSQQQWTDLYRSLLEGAQP